MFQARNIKESTPVISQKCGDTCVHKKSPIPLSEEYKELNDDFGNFNPLDIELKTRAQANSQEWFSERQCRLTASNFGKILQRKAAVSDKFLETLFSRKTIFAQSLEYGKRNEDSAKRKYLEMYPSRHFHECGLVVNKEFSFLGATPDGKVCDNEMSGIVEIKCPFSARNMTIEEAVNSNEIKDFCLEKTGNENTLKKNHQYYAQVQGQLMITGSDYCDFIVFTQKDLSVQRIYPDIEFMEPLLAKLAAFFKNSARPYLQSKNTN